MSIHQPWQSIWLPLDSFQGYADLWYINSQICWHGRRQMRRFPCGCQRHWRTQNRHDSVWLVNFIQQRKAKIYRQISTNICNINQWNSTSWLKRSPVLSCRVHRESLAEVEVSSCFIILMAGGWLLPRKCLSTKSFFPISFFWVGVL